MPVPRWVERTFDFAFPVAHYPYLIERLKGTPARVEARVRGLAAEIRTRREGDHWSIQEHAGHLLDLEELHLGRLDDYAAGLATLRAADMKNRKTTDANHNARPIEDLCRAFRIERERFVARLEDLSPEAWGQAAHHPRLNRPMRIIDLAFFAAEHDDHHLALMTETLRSHQMAKPGAR
jgi:uncharacterized damage-inducible protein DinB